MRSIKITVTEIRVDVQDRDELNVKKQSNHGQRESKVQKVLERIVTGTLYMLVVKGISFLWKLITS